MAAIGCQKAEDRKCFKSMGKVVQEHRIVEQFDHIVLSDHIDLILMDDTLSQLTIETGSNLINFISTDVSDNTLHIKDDNKCAFLRDLKHKTIVRVHQSAVASISMLGSGDLTAEFPIERNLSLYCNDANGHIDLHMDNDSTQVLISSGVTDVKLTGKSNYGYYYYFGNGNIHADHLTSDKVLVNWQSTGDLHLNSINELYGELTSSGNLYYSGVPSIVDISVTGTGQLIQQ